MGKRLVAGIDLGIASPCGLSFIDFHTEKLVVSVQVEQPINKREKVPTDEKIMAMCHAVNKAGAEHWAETAWCGFESAPFMKNTKTYGDMSRLSGALMWMLRMCNVHYMNVSVGEAKSSIGLPTRGTDKADVMRVVQGIYGVFDGSTHEHSADSILVARATVLKVKRQILELKAISAP